LSNAVRVAAAGAGVVVPLDGIRQGIELVLGNDKYRATARRIADEMRALSSVDEFLASSYDRASPNSA